jgi:hypothetical protein
MDCLMRSALWLLRMLTLTALSLLVVELHAWFFFVVRDEPSLIPMLLYVGGVAWCMAAMAWVHKHVRIKEHQF